MKVLIVSGFLGAGKTTLIEKLVQKQKKDFVVLENEYGDLGVDGDLLKNDGMKIWELTEGCVCCSMKADFASSILTIGNSMNPEVLIVEPTGVGMLSSILQNIEKIQYDRIQILEPITIVDPFSIDTCLKEYKEIFEDQIKNSKRIVISKVEEKDEIAERKIREINPNALIINEPLDEIEDEFWVELLEQNWNKNVNSIESMKLELENISFEDISFNDLDTFLSYMGAIVEGRFGSVIRAKGFAPINKTWIKFDIVDKKYSIEEIKQMDKSKIVLIGKRLEKDNLEILFKG